MLKFLYMTDQHNRVSNPTARLDNFSETIFKKQTYVGQRLAQEVGADAILMGGDLLDKADNPDKLIRQLQILYKSFNIPVLSVIGNHEEFGYNPDTFERSSFGLLEGPGIVQRLSMDKPSIFEKNGTKVAITGCDAHFDLDKNNVVADYCPINPVSDAVNIHIVHGFLTDDPKKWEEIPHTFIGNIVCTKADVVLSGHEHSGFEVIKCDVNKCTFVKSNKATININDGEKLFCNPGALARVSAAVGDINLEVKVALITVDGSNVSIELIKLPGDIAKSANEVLDWQKLEQEKESKKQMEKFIAKVNNVETLSSFNPYEVLEGIAKEESLAPTIIDGVREEIAAAEEQLASERVTDND